MYSYGPNLFLFHESGLISLWVLDLSWLILEPMVTLRVLSVNPFVLVTNIWLIYRVCGVRLTQGALS